MPNVIIVNSPGPQGPIGDQGPTGPAGPSGSLNNFTGSAEISGSLEVIGSITFTGLFSNPAVIEDNLTTKTGYNSLLVGPITNEGTITVVTGSRLKII
jgi:hypothetical protein